MSHTVKLDFLHVYVLVLEAFKLTFRNRMVLIMKLASCSSFSTVTPTPLYTSSLSRPAGQYCTHITRMKSNVLRYKKCFLSISKI